MVAYNKFNQFVQDLANKKHDLSADTFKVMLTNVAPVAANAVKGDITDIASGNGYTAGGTAAAITSSLQASGVLKWILGQVVFTATGNMAAFRYAVLYNDTQSSPVKPLIAWFDYGSSINMTAGSAFTVAFDGTNGVLTLT